MTNNRWIKIIILTIAVVFASTVVNAKSSNPGPKEYSKSWWHMPYYQMKKATKQAKDLQMHFAKLNRYSNHLEKKAAKLQHKIDSLSKQLNDIKEQMAVTDHQRFSGNNNDEPKKEKIICPGCKFQETDQFENGDFSGGFLQYANFDQAYLNGADFTGAKLKKASFWRTQLKGAIMSGDTDLDKAFLASANLCGATLPADISQSAITWYLEAEGYKDTICPDNSWAKENGKTCEGDHLIPVKDLLTCKDLP